jgi:UDP-N-acetylglucosamine--N-acetylmuramyl-(pentapeptide) pyrophosphoryl-undecaprenol N-acetylglucosamine transferase
MKPCVFIAAGGTGGHIYPAIAIAEEFRRQAPEMDVLFIGTPSGLESKIIPKRGFSILHIPVGRLNGVSKLEKILTLLRLPLAFLSSFRLLRKHRPKIVLGVGGYASGPILLVASILKIPTAIWEPNAMPGLTNRWLARFVDECFLVFQSARHHLKAKHFINSGMPVRTEIESIKGLRSPTPRTEMKHLFVFGGSQGAKAMNTVIADLFRSKDEFAQSYDVVHQTGPSDFARVKNLYGSALTEVHVELTEYVDDMEKRYEWADVVIARAGAASVAELAACGKVAILIPLPTAADNHQQKNAEVLVASDAAIMILQKDLTPEKLRITLQELEASPNQRQLLESNIGKFHQPRAAQRIVEYLLAHS